MDRHDDAELDRDITDSSTVGDGEHHATTTGAAAAGAVTGGVIGMTGGPIGAAIGAVGGAIVGAAAERMMHSDDDAERAREATPTTGEVPSTFVDSTPVDRASFDTPGGYTPEHTTDLGRMREDDVTLERRPG